MTATHEHATTLRGFPSRSILHNPTISPSFLLSGTFERRKEKRKNTISYCQREI